jgi:DNA invertase Pin-like site-specific DNA recombinase
MKRVAIYTRISSTDQNRETQLCDLRPLAAARGYQIVGEYTDTISEAPRFGYAHVRCPPR